MDLRATDHNFGHLPAEISSLDTSPYVVVPFGYEATTSYRTGTKEGPGAIIRASWQVELYDEELDQDTCELGIATLSEAEIDRRTYATPMDQLDDMVGRLLDMGKFPVVLGGEHALSLGAIRAAQARNKQLSVLQFDAHADHRAEYESTPWSHACIMRRVADLGCSMVQVGIRNISRDEMNWIRQEKPPTSIFWARQFFGSNPPTPAEVVKPLCDPVWLTIDLDGFDPAEVPGVGTPEPGGLTWYQVIDILRELFATRHVVGCDVVELAPLPGDYRSDFLAAKLIYKIIGYHAYLGKQMRLRWAARPSASA